MKIRVESNNVLTWVLLVAYLISMALGITSLSISLGVCLAISWAEHRISLLEKK